MTGPSPIRILLVDDHSLFRKGLASLLGAEQDFEIVGEAADGREALQKARELMPDVVLMDLSMPGMNGLEATRRICEEMPEIRVVILTISDGDENLFEAIRSGAQGYLLKIIEPQALFGTLRGAMQGEASISRVMAAKLLREFSQQENGKKPSSGLDSTLSRREREVLELVAQGKINKEIATLLAIAENTVKNHIKKILEKLQMENRVQATAYALREGLVKAPVRKRP